MAARAAAAPQAAAAQPTAARQGRPPARPSQRDHLHGEAVPGVATRGVVVPGVTVPRQGRRAREIGQEGAESWWIRVAGGDENPTFGGAGSTVSANEI